MESDTPTDGLTVLRSTVRHPIDHLECFPAPEHVSEVRFSTEEVVSVCPVTGQPDLSSVVIEYRPRSLCVESKSLKLYLWSFRDRPVFCEALAAEIASEFVRAADPDEVRVTVTQRPRGGITTQATSTRHRGMR
jgi:7-cyano-7-deazaguanine reductase